ncbi:MAG: hypothetical protein DVB25_04970 [Verrucomicrobia bacterium]|nr:MAG: hypothetical protein DVB25_04970 [Verrucomicrobiota bacterium]
MNGNLNPRNIVFVEPTSPRSSSSSSTPPKDIFAEAREKYTIEDLWQAFGYSGTPKGTVKSPFREERQASFSIHSDSRAWKDHSTGESGDVIEFVRHALGGCDYNTVRDWFGERLGIDHHDCIPAPSKTTKKPESKKVIQWPAGIRDGNTGAWNAFATSRSIAESTALELVESGLVRPCTLEGHDCYIVTDPSNRAAEIRRLDRKPFGKSKAFPLRGVDKSWLPGVELLRQAPQETGVLITEGATDLLAAVDFYARYRRNRGGTQAWQPVTLLGASCRTLHPEAIELIRGRYVRIVPDADPAGDVMAEHWTRLLRKLECTVDVVTLPRNTDLSDHLSTISPTELFSR